MEPYPQTTQLAMIPHQRTLAAAAGDRCAPGDVLIGDVERNAVCNELGSAFAAGQLSNDELDQRLARAVVARTRGEAQLLVRDLGPYEHRTVAPSAPAAASSWTPFDFLVTLVLIGCVLAIAAMLLVSLAVSPGWFFGAVVGGTLAVLAGASGTQLLHRTTQRRPERPRSS